jgi:dolichyl-phosphate beta-glucosyltransferase
VVQSTPSKPTGSRSISVIVPAYNEEERLVDVLPVIWGYLKDHYASFELIVVDDGSTDSTATIVQEFIKEHPWIRLISYSPNHGKGCAVRTGILEAREDLVLFCDADLATPMEETEILEVQMDAGFDIAIASRAISGSQLVIRQPWFREYGGRALNRIIQFMAVPGIHDTQCGFKLFRRPVAHEVFSRCREDGWVFDVEALHIAIRMGFKIAEVPVHWMHKEGSKVRVLRDAFRMLAALMRIARRHGRLEPVAHESRRI